MIKIYLCDDENAVRHQIKAALEWKICVENYDMKVACSAAGASPPRSIASALVCPSAMRFGIAASDGASMRAMLPRRDASVPVRAPFIAPLLPNQNLRPSLT